MRKYQMIVMGFAFAFACQVCVTAVAAGLEGLELELKDAELAFDRSATAARDSLLADFNKAIARLRRRRHPALLAQAKALEGERDKFEEQGVLPDSNETFGRSVKYLESFDGERKRLLDAANDVADRLAADGNTNFGKQIIADTQDRIRSVLPLESLNRSSWKGSHHWPGGNSVANLWFQHVDGADVVAILDMNRGATKIRFEGTVDGHKLSLHTGQVLHGEPRNLRFDGYVIGDRVKLYASGLTKLGQRARSNLDMRRTR